MLAHAPELARQVELLVLEVRVGGRCVVADDELRQKSRTVDCGFGTGGCGGRLAERDADWVVAQILFVGVGSLLAKRDDEAAKGLSELRAVGDFRCGRGGCRWFG